MKSLSKRTSVTPRSFLSEPLEPRRLMADAGNTLATATDLGTITTTASAAETVGAGDVDIYKFTLPSISDVNVSLDTGNVYQQIVWDKNSNGLIDGGETLTGRSGGTTGQRLPGGNYYVVLSPNGAGGNFNLAITTAAAAADPGSTFTTATDLGTITSTVNRNDWVGAADESDGYKFSLASTTDVNVSLDVGAYQQLVWDKNSNGIVDNGETLTGRAGGTAGQRLDAGTYYLFVSANGNGSLYYNVAITTAAAPADPAGTLVAARDIGTVTTTTTLSDWVGAADEADVYKFALPSISDVNVSLDAGAYQQLVWDKNNNGIVDNGETLTGRAGGTTGQRLEAGTYYLVVSSNGNGSLYYGAAITRTAAAADPGGTLAAASDLGAISSAASRSDWVGAADEADVYKFTLSSTSDVTFSLDAGAYQQVIWDKNSNGIIDSGETLTGRAGGTLHQRFGAGTYYVVVSSNGNGSLYYTAAVSRTAAAADPGNTLLTATDLGQPSGSTPLSDWVGSADTDDFYKFNVPLTGSVTLSTNAGIYMQLVKDANDNKIIDSGDVLQGRVGGSITTTLAAGTYYLTASANGNSDLFYDVGITTPVVTRPVLSGVVVDNGTVQRSRVRSLTLLFDDTNPLVDFATGAFSLTQTGGTPASVAMTIGSITKPTAAKTAVTLTFTGSGLANGSLPDGRYTLRVDGTKITDAAGVKADALNNGVQGSILQYGFHRLTGDLDGDRGVSINDFNLFSGTFGRVAGQPGYLDGADFDGDGGVSINDFNLLSQRFAMTI